jgi:hypothetical protein
MSCQIAVNEKKTKLCWTEEESELPPPKEQNEMKIEKEKKYKDIEYKKRTSLRNIAGIWDPHAYL